MRSRSVDIGRQSHFEPPVLSVAPGDSDPVAIFEQFNANFGNKILTAAVVHFRVCELLLRGPLSFDDLRLELGLAKRPAHVIVTALLAFGLLGQDSRGLLDLTETARSHLDPDSPYCVADYLHLAADARGVNELVQALRTNRPASAQYIKAGNALTVMDDPETARRLTSCLAGRAFNCAPVLAQQFPLGNSRLLVDVGGGTGIFSIAYLQKHPHLRAVILDLPAVLEVAREYASQFGVSDRMEFLAANMFKDPFPNGADVFLLSNVLHDWDEDKCDLLVRKCADALPTGGHLLVHDAFLHDSLDGPYHIAIYSVVLLYLTEGRAYSVGECCRWLRNAGMVAQPVFKTRVHCSVLPAIKPGA